MLEMIYGGGLRVSELVQLRVKDLDFESGSLTVRAGKGGKDRVTFLPKRLVSELTSPLHVICDSNACIVAGTEAAMRKHLKYMDGDLQQILQQDPE
ncbi:MAG: tyrosine-type recombinase/integrase [Candidatus Marinimicrobia bacterium]|nr:tyrosine-type recombinase/integrase [Candidatus Neomarinimicrobiota bacterium]